MRSKAWLVVAVWLASSPVWGADELTPRQSLTQVEASFAQGHRFTADESLVLADLERRLKDDGDTDLASDLALLRRAAALAAQATDNQEAAQAHLADDGVVWRQRLALEENRGWWTLSRNLGLGLFAASMMTTVLLATAVELDDVRTSNGTYSDWSARQDFVNKARWGVVISAGVGVVSLFPLLWGESRQ